jgi:hypothetical protein
MLLVALVWAGTASATLTPNVNLIFNPGFEGGVGYPWSADGSNITLSTDAHTGSYSADVYYPSDYKAIFQEIGGLTAGDRLQTYVFTYSVKAATQDDVGALIWCGIWEHVARSPWWVIHGGDMHALTADWQTYTNTFTLTENDTDAFRTVVQGALQAPGNFRVDDVSVIKTPEPITMALLGLGAVIGIRKRK